MTAWCGALFAVLAGAVHAAEAGPSSRLSLRNEFLLYGNRVTGSDPGGSFLTPGRFAVDNLALNHERRLGAARWETGLDVRVADDPRIQARRVTLTRFSTRLAGEGGEAVLGDVLAALTPYTLNSALKGGRLGRRVGGGVDLSAAAGLAKPSWDDVWNHNRGENVDRRVFGLRAARRFAGEAALGASLVWTKDSRARYDAAGTPQDQRIAGVDWSLPTFRRLWLRGEEAFSKTEAADPAKPATSRRGWAHLLKADYSFRRLKTAAELERVSPGYATAGGAAVPDLVRLHSASQWRLVGPWRALLNASWFHNNLDHAGGASTSRTRLAEAGVRYDGPDWRPTLWAESKLRWREVTASATGARSRTRSAVASAADRLGPVNAALDYEFQDEDRSDGTVLARHHVLGLGLSSAHAVPGGLTLMPSLRFNLQRDRDGLTGKSDQADVLTANLAARSARGFDAGLGWSRSLVLNAVNPGADRRSWTASAGYDIVRGGVHRLELRLRQNDNRFGTPGKDFKESVWELALNSRL